jgi:dTDP-4-dehydrorhamnose 3,5-epimerase
MKKNFNKIKIIKLNPFKDNRGIHVESFNKKKYLKLHNVIFVQDNFSKTKKNVLRGFHGDNKTWKLISCIKGKVQFAYINNNKRSKNYKKNKSIILNDKKSIQVLIPPKYCIAYLVLSKIAIIHYKQSSYYGQYRKFYINYQSPCLNFNWRLKKIITSKKDKCGLFLN